MDELAAARERVRGLQARLKAEGDVQCIETHVSWVLLAGDQAYKIKKPLDLGFLDYSTLARRRHACAEEVRLNRRSAPELYRDVVAITGHRGDTALNGTGPVTDYAVRMQRFPADALLADRLAAGELDEAVIDAVAAHVSDFHARAEVAPAQGPFGTAQAVHEPARENFEPIRAQIRQPALRERVDWIERWTEAAYQRLAPVFESRLRAGRVRECHGDLHLRNIAMVGGAPRLFDAIEFSESLRWTDVMADIAFLVMDLQAAGREDLAARVLNAYLEAGGDYDGLRVLRYYVVYRAMVRAKIVAIRLSQAPDDGEALRRDLEAYLTLADRVGQPSAPCLVLMSGVSGTGKSVQALRLVSARGFVRIRSDVERKRLAGLSPDARSDADVREHLYSEQMSRRTFDRLTELAQLALEAGYRVVVDATFIRRELRDRFRALADVQALPCVLLALHAPVAALHRRVAQRAAQAQDASEATREVLDSQLATQQPLDEDERLCAIEVDATTLDWPAVLAQLDALCGCDPDA